MIRSLHIQNYQSHKDTLLELVPGINVIGGHSDCGKSGILRAFYWLIFNRPLGDGFRSTWGGDTEVAATLSDGTVVRRVKSGKENYYAVGEEILRAGGSEVPQVVRDTLLLDEVNVQRQMDAPFLLSSSPSEVARVFNTAVHLDSIDLAFSNANSTVRELSSQVAQAEIALAADQEALEGFLSLSSAEEVIKCAQDLSEEAGDLEEQHHCLQQILVDLEKAWAGHTRVRELVERAFSKLDKAEAAVGAVTELAAQVATLEKEEQTLQRLVDAIATAQDKQARLKLALGAADKEWQENMPAVCPLCDSQLGGEAF